MGKSKGRIYVAEPNVWAISDNDRKKRLEATAGQNTEEQHPRTLEKCERHLDETRRWLLGQKVKKK